ncbi:MAG: 50S ribosomal protein L5 [Verrucomicrobia bacterium]|nr:50S ribosomal protein L5 [Verrucomicrobiota bacterium]
MSALKDKYKKEVTSALREARKYVNPMQVPRIQKVVINMAVNTNVDKDAFKAITEDLARITGQRPLVTKAKKSVSNFRLREGMPIGAKVTLRGERMFEFLDRLINVALPRIRDFRGVPATSFDGGGNYSLGLQEQTIFPEIDPDNVKKVQGMDITIVTTARTDDEARDLLRHLGMPFATA